MKLNKTAKMKFNEVHKVFGESVMIAYENYVDARLALMEGKVSNTSEAFNNLKAIETLSLPDLSELTAYADHHISCMIKENEQAACEFQAAKQPILKPAVYTSRTMQAMANSIGMSYDTYVKHPAGKKHKNGLPMHGKQIGPYFHMTNTGLVNMIWDKVQKEGNRNILLSATYSDGEKIFHIKKG